MPGMILAEQRTELPAPPQPLNHLGICNPTEVSWLPTVAREPTASCGRLILSVVYDTID
ncbi:MAG TPA: hypothetical protein VGH27_30535 [Streptosporangiaceae bacterium]|jgi:hypothetical protein